MCLLVAKVLVLESFVLGAVHSGSGPRVPVNLQWDKCYFLFCNFLSLYEWESVILLKVRTLGLGFPVYFKL